MELNKITQLYLIKQFTPSPELIEECNLSVDEIADFVCALAEISFIKNLHKNFLGNNKDNNIHSMGIAIAKDMVISARSSRKNRNTLKNWASAGYKRLTEDYPNAVKALLNINTIARN